MSPVVFRLTFPCAIDSRQYLLRYVAGTVLGVGRTGGEEKDIGSRGERRDVNQLIRGRSIPLPAAVRAEGGAQGAGEGLVSEEDDGQGRPVRCSRVATTGQG